MHHANKIGVNNIVTNKTKQNQTTSKNTKFSNMKIVMQTKKTKNQSKLK